MDGQNKEPSFEWAIENPKYQNETGAVRRWGKALSSYGNYDYTDLGLTIVPGVYFTPADGSANTIGVLPGGLGHRLGKNDTQGKAFYIFNPIDGSILWKINSIATGYVGPSQSPLGMGVSPIIYKENSAKETVAFYTADSEGNILKCDTTVGSVYNWKLQSIFQLLTVGSKFENNAGQPPSANEPIVVPIKMVLARTRTGYEWLFGGTSNLYAPGSDTNDSRKIINQEQLLYGLNLNSIVLSPKLTKEGINPKDDNVRKLTYYADTLPGDYGSYGQPYVKNDETGLDYGMDDYGWILRLRPKFGKTGAEYLTANPFLLNNVIHFATFIPHIGANSEEACVNIGVGKLYALDPSTGQSFLDKPAITLENIKIAGISGNKDENRLTLSVKELKAGAIRTIRDNFSGVRDLGNGLVDIIAPYRRFDGSGDPDNIGFEELVPHVQYWREGF